ncbi:MAG: YHS domain-containing protein [FCB group bacterium]|nr:YHS domain-containing protein [FCB group bacterium]
MGNDGIAEAKTLKSTLKGKTYYFCCPACKPKFDKDPAKFLDKTEKI